MRSAAAIVLFVLTALMPAHTRAQERMEFIPSLSMFTVYDDNLFARTRGSAGKILQLRPSFEGNFESPTVRLLGLYSFDMQRSNHSALNTFDARRHALGEARFRTNPMTTLGMAMRYDRSETPGDINLETGILGDRRLAERWQLTPSYGRRIGVLTTMTASYDWSSEYLVDGERGTMHVGRIGMAHDVTSRTNLTAHYVGRYFIDDIENHHSHGVLFGWSRETGPGARLTLTAGPKTTSYDGFVPEVNAVFTRATNRLRLALDYWHGETIVLGIRGPVKVDSGTTRVSWPLTRSIEFGVHAGVSDITTLDAREATNYRGTLVGSWTPGGIYTVAASYGLDYQLGDIRRRLFLDGEPLLVDREIMRHVFRVSVTVAPRFRRSILPPDEAARAKGVSR
jgi:hypothetical protein